MSIRNSNYFYVRLVMCWLYIQLFQLRLSTSKAEKSNTSAKGCWESLINSFISVSDSQQPFALVFDFSALLGGQP